MTDSQASRMHHDRYTRRWLLRAGAAAAAGLAGGPVLAPGSAAAAGAKRGGVYSGSLDADPASLDPYTTANEGVAEFACYSYSRLFMLKSGPGIVKGSIAVVPDAAASYSVSKDGLTYVVQLRNNVRFHAPLDRTMTADDVVFSWDRMNGRVKGTGPSIRLANLNMVESVTAIGPLTVVFLLKTPYPFFTGRLADPKGLVILPKEAWTSFNPAEKMIGSGPWIMGQYTPDTVVVFRRNPAWHLGPALPYYDTINLSVIPSYATRLTQFQAGHLDALNVDGADLQRLKDTVPGVQIYETPEAPLSLLNFSPREPRWDDVRLRLAVSMALDRDAMLESAYSLKQVAQAGFPVTLKWHNNVPAAFSDYWLNPKGSRIRQKAAAGFKYNPAAAKQLVAAAGGPFDTEFHFAAANSRYGDAYRVIADLTVQYLGQIGINARAIEEDYNAVFIPQTGEGGRFNGMMYIPQTRTDPFAHLQFSFVNPSHPLYGHWSHPAITERIVKIQSLLDPAEIRAQILDVQNDIDEAMFIIPMEFGAAPSFVAYQPYMRNVLQYQSLGQGGATENLPSYWSSR